jgi:hypothetical protein
VLAHYAAAWRDERFRSEAELYLDHDWQSEPFVRGGYSCNTQPGALTAVGAPLDTPLGA